LLAWIEQQGARMTAALSGGLQRRDQRLRDLSRALPRPDTLLDGPRQRLDTSTARLGPALMGGVQKRKIRLSEAAGGLRPAALSRMIANERRSLDKLTARLGPALGRAVATKSDRFTARAGRFDPLALGIQIAERRTKFDATVQRISEAGHRRIAGLRQDIDAMDRLRETLSYKATLARGYAVVRGDGDVVTSKAAAGKAGVLEIEFSDGRLSLNGKPSARKAADKPTDQGSLF
jgi:exodeoxyribonuclease VII large subunit